MMCCNSRRLLSLLGPPLVNTNLDLGEDNQPDALRRSVEDIMASLRRYISGLPFILYID